MSCLSSGWSSGSSQAVRWKSVACASNRFAFLLCLACDLADSADACCKDRHQNARGEWPEAKFLHAIHHPVERAFDDLPVVATAHQVAVYVQMTAGNG